MTTMKKNFIKYDILGEGSYSKVYLATLLPPPGSAPQYLACKTAYKEKDSNYIEKILSLYVEADTLSYLRDCPDVIQCFGDAFTMIEDKHIYKLYLEFAPGGNLHNLIQRRAPFFWDWEVRWYTYKILKGLSYIHEKGFVHCDLKPANILVCRSPRTCLNYLKIADFGLAKRSFDDNPAIKIPGCFRCTPQYSSPESLIGVHESPMDIWSLGCVLYEMVTGKMLWDLDTKEELCCCLVMLNLPDDKPAQMSDLGRDFLAKCLDKNPNRRWTAKMLLDHPYIRDMKFEEIDEDKMMLPNKSPNLADWTSGVSFF